jgi:uncharacterized short protein YbdD (DUF466 family)
MKKLGGILRQGWAMLRRLSGDDAYECYLEHLQRRHPEVTPLNRHDFLKAEQERRWNGGPNRCC